MTLSNIEIRSSQVVVSDLNFRAGRIVQNAEREQLLAPPERADRWLECGRGSLCGDKVRPCRVPLRSDWTRRAIDRLLGRSSTSLRENADVIARLTRQVSPAAALLPKARHSSACVTVDGWIRRLAETLVR